VYSVWVQGYGDEDCVRYARVRKRKAEKNTGPKWEVEQEGTARRVSILPYFCV